jgi:hypothetical protein
LFLVKPVTAGCNKEGTGDFATVERDRVGKVRMAPERLTLNSKGPGRVIPIGEPRRVAHQERWLGLMAAAAPLLWFGHAAWVWLKVV